MKLAYNSFYWLLLMLPLVCSATDEPIKPNSHQQEDLAEKCGGGGAAANTGKNRPPAQHVVELTAEDFSAEKLAVWPPRFVMFYAPWCASCQKLKPVWELVARVVDDEQRVLRIEANRPPKKKHFKEAIRDKNLAALEIARIDCDVYADVCNEMSIMSYPTFLYFTARPVNHGRVLYRGKRDVASFTRYLDRVLEYGTYEQLAASRYAHPVAERVAEWSLQERLEKHKFQNFLIMFYYDTKVTSLIDRVVLEYLTQSDVVEPLAVQCPRTQPERDERESKMPPNNDAVQYCSLYGPPSPSDGDSFTLAWFMGPNMLAQYGGPALLYDLRYFIEFMDDGRNLDQTGRNLSSEARQILQHRYNSSESAYHEGIVDLDSPEAYLAHVRDGRSFVFFYVPWCTHSNDFSVTFTIAAMHFQDDASVSFARVNCIKQREICSALKIEYFPHFIYYHDGRALSYDTKNRKLEEIVDYISKMKTASVADVDREFEQSRQNIDTMPGSKTADNAITVTTTTWKDRTAKSNAFVMFYSPYCEQCSATMPAWNALALKYNQAVSALVGAKPARIYKVDCMNEMDLCNRKLTIDRYPSFVWYENGVEIDRHLGERELIDLEAFMHATVGQSPKKPNLDAGKPEAVKMQQMLDNNIANIKIDNNEDQLVVKQHHGAAIRSEL